MARKNQQQSDDQPDVYEGGVLVTPERRAYLESLKGDLHPAVGVVETEVDEEDGA